MFEYVSVPKLWKYPNVSAESNTCIYAMYTLEYVLSICVSVVPKMCTRLAAGNTRISLSEHVCAKCVYELCISPASWSGDALVHVFFCKMPDWKLCTFGTVHISRHIYVFVGILVPI